MTDKMTAEQALPNPKDALAYLIHRIEPGKNIHSANNVERAIASLRQALAAPRVPDELPHWEPCNPACCPELGGFRDRGCAAICEPARQAMLTAAPAPADVNYVDAFNGDVPFPAPGQSLVDALRERLESSDTSPEEIKQRVDLRLENIKLRERVKVLEDVDDHYRAGATDLANAIKAALDTGELKIGLDISTMLADYKARLRGGSDE